MLFFYERLEITLILQCLLGSYILNMSYWATVFLFHNNLELLKSYSNVLFGYSKYHGKNLLKTLKLN